jgi:dCMP deaminase
MGDRLSWDQYWLGVAEAVSKRAACTRRQVGALVVMGNRIISTGYNGAAPGHPHCTDGACPRGKLSYEEFPVSNSGYEGRGRCIAVHAEANALRQAGRLARGAYLYSTAFPCNDCLELVLQYGIGHIVSRHEGDTTPVIVSMAI